MPKGRNVIVTGSTSGIGRAIAEAFAQQGCNIIFNGMGDRNTIDHLIEETARKYQIKAFYADADMSKPVEIAKMVAEGQAQLGSIDILINNAGIQFTARVEEFPNEKWDAIIAINLSAAFHAAKAALPGMQKRNFGRIINIASAHGLVGSEMKIAYVSAKHGIAGMTKVVALENAKADITCNAICPGWVYTPLVQKQIEDQAQIKKISIEDATKQFVSGKQPNNRFIQPEDIGAMCVFLCGGHAGCMTGEIISMDGGWTAQ